MTGLDWGRDRTRTNERRAAAANRHADNAHHNDRGFPSRFGGTCTVCAKPFFVGARIRKAVDRPGYEHANCRNLMQTDRPFQRPRPERPWSR